MGERSLIAAIEAALALPQPSRVVRWIGDDCAVVRGDAFAAVSVDVMVDGTHFRLGDVSPADASDKVRNANDIESFAVDEPRQLLVGQRLI
jgi:thiamine-monophosphate kinase